MESKLNTFRNRKKTKLLLALCFTGSMGYSQIITTYAGNGTLGHTGDGGQAVLAELNSPTGVALDAAGNLYIADGNNNRIRKVTPTGIISTVVGTGTAGYSGDGGQASAAELNFPCGITFDGSGNLYIADNTNGVVRKVIMGTGVISTVAGNGTSGSTGNGGQASAAELTTPRGVVVDASGNLYISDFGADNVRVVDASGIISLVAGTGIPGYSGDGGQASAAELYSPWGLTLNGGNLYIAEWSNSIIRKVILGTGVISTVAGNGTSGFSGDAGQATAAELWHSSGVTFDASGNFYITDEQNRRIRMVNASGVISTYAGNGTAGCTGDCGAAASAELVHPTGEMAINSSGNFFFADGEDGDCQRVRMISTKCPADAGPNETNQQSFCGSWTPGVTIGTSGCSGLTYSWLPTTNLNPTNTATTTSTYSTTSSSSTIIYTLTVSSSTSLCATNTSTVQVTAIKTTCPGCCRQEAGIATEYQGTSTFVVFPNPSTGELTVRLSNKADYIQVLDITGRLIFEAKDLAAGETKVDLSKYNKGIYFMSVKTGSTTEKQKLIIE